MKKLLNYAYPAACMSAIQTASIEISMTTSNIGIHWSLTFLMLTAAYTVMFAIIETIFGRK